MPQQSDKRRQPRSSVAWAAYYSDGAFHASAITENLTTSGGCLKGTHVVNVGMELIVLLIPPVQRALLIKKATVRWVDDSHFGVELQENHSGMINELTDEELEQLQGPSSLTAH